jgi:hypothetical protein
VVPAESIAFGMVVGSRAIVVVSPLLLVTVVTVTGRETVADPVGALTELTAETVETLGTELETTELETELLGTELETELETAELETELLGTELETQLETAEAAALDETDGLVTTATGETETVDETTDPDESVV